MNQALTIFRRELRTYFTSPIGYIYLIAFLLFANLLGLGVVIPNRTWFDYPVADMRDYFRFLGAVSAFLLAAVTMRLWSEERKENTYEMLLTFPMKARDLVLGKFLASVAFYVAALVGTLAVPVMMAWLSKSGPDSMQPTGFFGGLDLGTVACGYLAALLLGMLYIAFGLFISGLCRDQIVAFVLTAPCLFAAYLIGVGWVQDNVNELFRFSGGFQLGNWLGEKIGIVMHYDKMAGGLLRLADVLFFGIWIVIFLILNVLATERRSRPNANMMYAASAVLMIGIGLAANHLLADRSLGQLDVTKNQRYTIDTTTGEVLGDMEDVVSVRYIVSPPNKFPKAMQNLERDVREKLETLRRISGGKLRFTVVRQQAVTELKGEEKKKDDKQSTEDALKERLLKKVQPFAVQSGDGDSITAQFVYSGIEISYKDKESEVISPLTVQQLPQLEYQLVKFVHRMQKESMPVVALVAPREVQNPQMVAMMRQMGRPVPPPNDPYQYLGRYIEREGFQVRRVELTKTSPLPEDYDVLMVIAPEKLEPRQQWEINRALVNGTPVVLAVQNHEFDYQISRQGLSARHVKKEPRVNRFLGVNHVTVGEELLMDRNATVFTGYSRTPVGFLPQMFPKELRMHSILSGESLNGKHPLLKGMDVFRYVWGTTINLDEAELKKAGLKSTPIFRSGRECWKRSVSGEELTDTDIAVPSDPSQFKQYELGVLIEGQFKDAFDGREPPAWPETPPNPMQPPRPPTPSPTNIDPKPGKLLLIANAHMFHRDILTEPVPGAGGATFAQGVFFLQNCASFLSSDELLRKINALKHKMAPQTSVPDLRAQKNAVLAWKLILFLFMPLVIVAAGIGVWMMRGRRRDAYAAALGS